MKGSARWGLVPAVFMLGVCAAACAKPSAAKLNGSGNQAYGRGDYDSALEDYLQAQVQRPDVSGFNYNAGNALNAKGEYEQAIAESLRATDAGSADVRVRSYYAIGADYFGEGKLKEALDAYKNALRIDPSDLDTKYNIEVIQRRLQKEAADRQQLGQQSQNQQNQPAQQGQQSQPGQQGQQNQQGQQGQQQGQQSAGQQSPGGSGQQSPGGAQQSSGQPGGQGSPGGQQPSQGSSAPGAAQPGNGPFGQPGSSATDPSLRAQQAQLTKELQAAQQAYNKAPSIEEALHILDILARQEALAQSAQSNRSDPQSLDK